MLSEIFTVARCSHLSSYDLYCVSLSGDSFSQFHHPLFFERARQVVLGSVASSGGYLSTSAIRILLVDDFKPFRHFVVSTLQTKPELQVVGELSDGLEAVQKAQELLPDLILLDIGLPTLNGINAARRIRGVSPKTKIIFLSLETSAEIVKQAFSLGAHGYVVKMDAAGELLAAVTAVLRGDRFVGTRFAGDDLIGGSEIEQSADNAPGGFSKKNVFRSPATKGTACRHEVGFWEPMPVQGRTP